MQLPAVPGAVGLSLAAFPVSYALNCGAALAHPVAIAMMGVLVLLILFCMAYLLGEWSQSQDPLFYVFTVFSFTSVIDLIISLEEDGYISGFMEFYLKEGEPYLRTAYGIMICYWDGIVHYVLYLAMIMAITQRKNYRTLGLYWLGSLMMSIVVFLPGNMLGKYSSEIRPSFLLNVPYILIPIWAGMRLFSQPKSLPCCTAEKVVAEQQRSLYQRPLDLGLILFLMVAATFTFFRGLVVLDCPSDSCFNYIYQYEPYLRDPVAYPKVQMLVYMFYVLPFFCLGIYGLLRPGCTWLPDWALVFAGAIAQLQGRLTPAWGSALFLCAGLPMDVGGDRPRDTMIWNHSLPLFTPGNCSLLKAQQEFALKVTIPPSPWSSTQPLFGDVARSH
uniref:Transmembrane 6 superfamily member 2 n=1 Tax=Gopherus evgoodei TaxID=1825980 RepID=A0A8C4XZ90_9SAUR